VVEHEVAQLLSNHPRGPHPIQPDIHISISHTLSTLCSGGLSFMKSLLPGYFSSEWSVAQFRVPDSLSLCAFGSEPNSIIVLTAEGVVYTCTFDPVHGGECTQENLTRFLGDGDGIDQTKFAGKTPEHEDDHDHDDHDHDET